MPLAQTATNVPRKSNQKHQAAAFFAPPCCKLSIGGCRYKCSSFDLEIDLQTCNQVIDQELLDEDLTQGLFKNQWRTCLHVDVAFSVIGTSPQAAGSDVLVAVTGQTINSLDLHRTVTNRASYQVAVSCYDRLVSFGTREAVGGGLAYDYSVIEPELAESWTVSDDGLTFKLKSEARFWDGEKVTASDVKWSFDRAVSVGGFPSVQMKAGGLTRPEQFVAVDENTFVIKLDQPSKLTDSLNPHHTAHQTVAEPLSRFVGMRAKLGMSYLFVSHDLHVVRLLCDHVIVMKDGEIVEAGDSEAVMSNPRHHYTQALLAAAPSPLIRRTESEPVAVVS